MRSCRAHLCAIVSLALWGTACGGTEPPASRPCDAECQDGNAMKALRETMKLVYNLTLQGRPVGSQDATTPCPEGGSARIFGDAASNAAQGTTEVRLTYELSACAYLERDDDAEDNYDMTSTGTVVQEGVLAVQPNETTALVMQSESITLSGTVYDPPIDYDVAACVLRLGQSGDELSGTICGRAAGAEL